MKIATIIVRILMGLMFLFASISYFFKLFPVPEMKGAEKIFNDGVAASIYLMPLIKVIELLCGLLFVVGRYVALATVVIFPIVVNIFCYHAFVGPEGLPVAVPLLLCNLFLAYAYRKNYTGLFAAK